MNRSRRAGLAGTALLALALAGAPALAQSDQDVAGKPASEPQAPVVPGQPLAAAPSATETPQAPAAAGGEASDMTPSGAPAGSIVQDESSDHTSPSPAPVDTAKPLPGAPAETETPEVPAASGGGASGATVSGAPEGAVVDEDAADKPAASGPRNAVGDKFQLPHLTAENQIRMITDICGTQIRNMDRGACHCLAEQAMTALTPPQRDYLIASAVAPPVAARMLKDNTVGQPDQKVIFTFLNQTSDACATGTFTPPTDSTGVAPPSPARKDDAAKALDVPADPAK